MGKATAGAQGGTSVQVPRPPLPPVLTRPSEPQAPGSLARPARFRGFPVAVGCTGPPAGAHVLQPPQCGDPVSPRPAGVPALVHGQVQGPLGAAACVDGALMAVV